MNAHSTPQLSAADNEVESLLARLMPARPAFDTTAILSQAVERAQAAGRRARWQIWVWRSVSAGLAACAAMALWPGKTAAPHERVIVQVIHDGGTSSPANPDAPASAETWASDDRPAPMPAGTVLALRDNVLARGLIALPDPRPAAPGGPRINAEAGRLLQSPPAGPGALHLLLQPFTRPFTTGDQL